MKPEQLEQKNFERFEKYRQVEATEAMYEAYCMEDATLCIVSFGITARVAKNAIAAARAQGIKVGMIRPITLWPFPKATLCEAAEHVQGLPQCGDEHGPDAGGRSAWPSAAAVRSTCATGSAA